jgi:hypothetical protein
MCLRKRPFAFTEHGVAMLSSVLHSDQALDVNIAIMQAFVHLRELLATHKDLAKKVQEMEKKYDTHFKVVFEAIRQLMAPSPKKPKGWIGFHLPGSEDQAGAAKPGDQEARKRRPEPNQL